MEEDNALVVFARFPVPGKVKTRLAATIGPERACSFYKDCAEHVFKQASRVEKTTVVLFNADAKEHDDMGEWMKAIGLEGFVLESQIQVPNLGSRMFHAMDKVLKSGAKKVVIVGTDVPDLSTEIMDKAFAILNSHEMVVGPAVDGGYYLLGLTRIEEKLFEGVEWSTSSVLSATVANAEKIGIDVAPLDSLPTLQDIDTIQDLHSWLGQQEGPHPLLDCIRSTIKSMQE